MVAAGSTRNKSYNHEQKKVSYRSLVFLICMTHIIRLNKFRGQITFSMLVDIDGLLFVSISFFLSFALYEDYLR